MITQRGRVRATRSPACHRVDTPQATTLPTPWGVLGEMNSSKHRHRLREYVIIPLTEDSNLHRRHGDSRGWSRHLPSSVWSYPRCCASSLIYVVVGFVA